MQVFLNWLIYKVVGTTGIESDANQMPFQMKIIFLLAVEKITVTQ